MSKTRQRQRARPTPPPPRRGGAAALRKPASPAIFDAARIQRVADRVAEGACLAAVAAIPLYFSLLTTTVYETDKAVLLIALGILAATAWAVGAVTRWRAGGVTVSREPLLWLGLAVVVAYGLGTIFSVNPWESLVGSYLRHGGLLTQAAAFAIFLCVATRLTTRAQIERLITVLIFASLPAVVYGLFQQIGLDPLPGRGDPATIEWPVRSFFGEHVLFGSYLVLVIPLTAVRFIIHRERREPPAAKGSLEDAVLAAALAVITGLSFVGFVAIGQRSPTVTSIFVLLAGAVAVIGMVIHELPDTAAMRAFRTWGYGILLALQILTLVITSARGPLLAFLLGIPIFALLVAIRQRLYRLGAAIVGVSALIVLVVAVLNIPGGPLEGLRNAPGLTKLAHLQVVAGGESSTSGRLQVWNGIGTLLTKQPAIGSAFGGPARDIVGYGPDTLQTVFEAVFPLQLRQQAVEAYVVDRAHSVYLDRLVGAGVLCLLAFLALIAYFFVRMLRALLRVDRPTSWLMIGIVTAVAVHLLEGVTGFETAVSLLLLWIYLAFARTLPDSAALPAEEETRPIAVAPVLTYVGIALLALLLVAAIPDLLSHPTVLASFWVLSLLGAVAGAAVVARPRVEAPAPAPAATVRRGPLLAAVGILIVVGLLGLATQWRFETAAMADVAGSTEFAHGQLQAGLGDAQLAARAASYEPTFWNNLSSALLSVANLAGSVSLAGVSTSSASDAASLDPATVVTLSRQQVDALALASARQVVSLAPNDPTSFEDLGNTELSLGKPMQAFGAFAEAAYLSHVNPRYQDLLAVALLAAHDPARARLYAANGLQYDPQYWYTYYVLAQIDSKLGQHAAARAEAAQAIFWWPVAYPAPPAADLAALKRLEGSG